eukprot:Pgem_evm1s4574
MTFIDEDGDIVIDDDDCKSDEESKVLQAIISNSSEFSDLPKLSPPRRPSGTAIYENGEEVFDLTCEGYTDEDGEVQSVEEETDQVIEIDNGLVEEQEKEMGVIQMDLDEEPEIGKSVKQEKEKTENNAKSPGKFINKQEEDFEEGELSDGEVSDGEVSDGEVSDGEIAEELPVQNDVEEGELEEEGEVSNYEEGEVKVEIINKEEEVSVSRKNSISRRKSFLKRQIELERMRKSHSERSNLYDDNDYK